MLHHFPSYHWIAGPSAADLHGYNLYGRSIASEQDTFVPTLSSVAIRDLVEFQRLLLTPRHTFQASLEDTLCFLLCPARIQGVLVDNAFGSEHQDIIKL